MVDPVPRAQITILGDCAPEMLELIASYVRLRFPNVAVDHAASAVQIDDAPRTCRAIVLIEGCRLPNKNLAYAISQVRSIHPHSAIIVASAFPNAVSAANALRCGAHSHIPYVTPLSAFVQALQTALAENGLVPSPAATFDIHGSAEPSVELALTAEDRARSAPYLGPCRRRASAVNLSGRERRRPASK